MHNEDDDNHLSGSFGFLFFDSLGHPSSLFSTGCSASSFNCSIVFLLRLPLWRPGLDFGASFLFNIVFLFLLGLSLLKKSLGFCPHSQMIATDVNNGIVILKEEIAKLENCLRIWIFIHFHRSSSNCTQINWRDPIMWASPVKGFSWNGVFFVKK